MFKNSLNTVEPRYQIRTRARVPYKIISGEDTRIKTKSRPFLIKGPFTKAIFLSRAPTP